MAVFCHNLGASRRSFCLRHRAKARRKICFPCIRTVPVPVAQPSRARKAAIIHRWTLRPSIISTCIGLASSSAIFISMLAKKLWDEPRYHASALVFCPPAIPQSFCNKFVESVGNQCPRAISSSSQVLFLFPDKELYTSVQWLCSF